MATVTATVVSVEIVAGPLAILAADVAATTLKQARVWIKPSADMLAGDTLSCALNTAIQSAVRNGKTVTARSACLAVAAFDATASAAYGGKTQSLSGSTFTFIPTANDWSTNAALTAADRWERPYAVFVAYSEA